jgi:hypothetical protein
MSGGDSNAWVDINMGVAGIDELADSGGVVWGGKRVFDPTLLLPSGAARPLLELF